MVEFEGSTKSDKWTRFWREPIFRQKIQGNHILPALLACFLGGRVPNFDTKLKPPDPAMVPNPVPPVNIRFDPTTKIGSEMGGAAKTPKWDLIGF